MSNAPKIYIVEEHNPDLDYIHPKLATMNYPGMVIMHDTGAIVFSYEDMDILFNRFVAAVAKKQGNK